MNCRRSHSGPGRLRWPLLLVICLLATAGCADAGHAGAAGPPAHRNPGRRASKPAGPPPQLDPVGLRKPGSLIAQHLGRGPSVLRIHLPAHPTRLTVRYSCSGTGQTSIKDQVKLLMKVLGCASDAIYSDAFRGSESDRQIKVNVPPSVAWRLQVWSKTTG
jgi:hypothetical protein